MKTTIFSTTILLIFGMTINGQIIHVPTDQLTIQEGIDVATNGDTILVEQGTYYENIKFNGKAITVASHYLINQDSAFIYNTIINGSQPGPTDSACVVLFNLGTDTTSVLSGLTITGGSGCFRPKNGMDEKLSAGGGIMTLNCGAKITHNIITENNVVNNGATYGGGIYGANLPESQMIIIEDNLVSYNSVTNNSSVYGGGICIKSCHARINRNVIRNNAILCDCIPPQSCSTGSGGLWYSTLTSYTCYVTIEDNEVCENEVTSYSHLTDSWGGGMVIKGLGSNLNADINNNIIKKNRIEAYGYIYGNGVVLYRFSDSVIFSGNRIFENTYEGTPLLWGGGLFIAQCHPLISNNLICNNTAVMGGGIFVAYCHPQIINNTIFGNDASSRGGGLCFESSAASVVNSVVWLNTAPLGPDIWFEGTSIDMSYSDIWGDFPGIGNIDADPLFEDADNFDFHLTINSPCIDTGHPFSPLNPDLTNCDIGAYYFDHRPINAIDALDITGVSFIANWEEAEDATGYLIDVAYDINFTNYVEGFHNLDVGNTNSFLVDGLLSTTYYYRIRANYYFGRSGYSDTIPVILTSTDEIKLISTQLKVYPNPMTEESTIKFLISKMDLVSLSIIDITGREVEILISKNLPAGIHKIKWHAKGLIGGLYFLKLETNRVTETKKILVIN